MGYTTNHTRNIFYATENNLQSCFQRCWEVVFCHGVQSQNSDSAEHSLMIDYEALELVSQ